MLKTHYRDYATEAYRLHARLGSAAAYKRRVLAEALARRAESGGSVGSDRAHGSDRSYRPHRTDRGHRDRPGRLLRILHQFWRVVRRCHADPNADGGGGPGREHHDGRPQPRVARAGGVRYFL